MADNNTINIGTGSPLAPSKGGTGVSNSTNTLTIGATSYINQDVRTTASPIFANINDSNNNKILGLITIASAVNSLTITNNATGNAPALAVTGSDTNIGMSLSTQGTGQYNIYTKATSNQFIFNTGSSLTDISTFTFNSTNTTYPGSNYTFPNASGTLCMDTSSSGSISTSPPVSSASTLALGTAYQNTAGYDVILTIYISVSAATTASILLGVGSTSTPTQQTIVSSLTLAAINIISVPIYLPNNYYALLSTSGTITASISGQIAMPV